MTKIDKEGTLLNLDNILLLKKHRFIDGKYGILFKFSDGTENYAHSYPSEASMNQWFSIISKSISK
ncbi:MAG: hypothetical protein ACRCXT_05070 [Paraclostridium sp.]